MKRVLPILVTVALVAFAAWIVLTGQFAPPTNGGVGDAEPNPGATSAPAATPGTPVPALGSGIPVPSNAEEMTVVSVHDGDTLDLRDRTGSVETVRIIGIDTPEVYPEYECFGDEATEALRRLAPVGSVLRVVTDEEPFDRYDRLLLYLWNDDDVFVNLALVEGGYAEAIRVRPNDRHWNVLRDAAADAERAGLGMWSC